MKKIRLMTCMMACVALVLGLTACGSNASDVGKDNPVPTVNTSEESTGVQTQEITDESSLVTDNKETADSDVSTDNSQPSTGKDTLVVVFSATGTTKGVAEKIASITDADLYEIIPAEPYSDADLDWNDKNSRTTIEQNDASVRPAIASEALSFEGYKTIYIGYPIWWGEEPRIMDTFVESYSFDGITVIPFCTSGGSGKGRSGKNLAEHAGSGNWLDGDRLQGSASEADIQSWIDGLQ